MSKLLITGATGQLGKEVLHRLIEKNGTTTLAALVRNPDKADDLKALGVDIRQGDYNDYASLVAAFEGVSKLYFVSGSDVQVRAQQHENVINAAKEAGVEHVVYTSFLRENETETSPIAALAEAHIKTEHWLKASGLTYTLLKHSIYLDFVPMFIGDQVTETGVLYFPAGEGKVGFVLRSDMAEVAAMVLTTEGHANQTYDITNEKAVSFGDIAAAISRTTGKDITYVSPSGADYIKTLTEAGVPMQYAGMFAGFGEAFRQGEFAQASTTIERLLGRKPVSMAQFIEQVYSIGVPAV